MVAGRPDVVKVTSPSLSYRSEEYTISWETASLLPVLDYSIKYRSVPSQQRSSELFNTEHHSTVEWTVICN